jgi:tetratricopeptide (TPR) repeat protein
VQTEGAFSAQGAIDEVDRTIKESSDPARALLHLTIEAVRQDNPALAEAIRYCAIPRYLDPAIVGVLRDAPEDRAANEKLLADLASLHLVTPRSDGSYVYHERRRTLLFDDWRSDAERRARFDQVNQRLVSFFEGQHRQAQELEHDLERIKPVLLNASSNRYVQATSAVRQRVLAPLFEALYHEILRSAERGYSLFSRYCEPYEARGLLTVCELLRSAARSNLEALPPGSGQDGPLLWLAYWEARILRSYRRHSEAEKILRELLPKTESDTRLRLWTLGDLGMVLGEQVRLREASEFHQQELSLAESTRADAFNLPVTYSRVAGRHLSLGELDEAAARYRDAIASARREHNPRMEAFCQFDLSGVLQDRGEWMEALNAALEGLHVARTRGPQNRNIQQAAVSRLMALAARRDPALLDTLFKEGEVLSGEPILAIDHRNLYVSLLETSGQLERAVDVLGRLRKDAAGQMIASYDAELLFREALMQQGQGRVDETLAAYDAMIRAAEEGRGTLWHVAAALSNQASFNADCARWADAESAARKALEQWGVIGNEKLAALVRVFSANAARGQGRLAEAQALLDRAAAALGNAPVSYRAEFHQTQAAVYREQALWAQAEEQFRLAASFYRSVDRIKQAARVLADSAMTASCQGHWGEAARYTAEAHEFWRQLTGFADYRPSAEAQAADEENAEGISHFFAPGENRRRNLIRAQESFRAAGARIPRACWYLLNLAHASAELEDWPEAARAVEAALACVPPSLQSPVLYDWVAEYRTEQASAQFNSGRFGAAGHIFADARALLEGRVGRERWLKILLGAGDSALKLERWESAKADYESGLELARSASDPGNQARFHARLGFLAACHDDVAGAVGHFKVAVRLRGAEPTLSDLVDCSSLVTSLPEYHRFARAARALERDPEPGAERNRLVATRLEISRRCYRRSLRPLATAAKADFVRNPYPVPLALEADSRLFPEGAGAPQDRLVNVELPELRKRVESSMGVPVPGVRIRSNNNLGDGGYVLVLNDAARVYGTVSLAERYCPDAAACEARGVFGRPAVNPWNGKPGMWLAGSAVEQAAAAALAVLDAYQYMLAHLEWFIRGNLSALVGIQEVHSTLEQWAKDRQERRDLLHASLPDPQSRVRMTHVVQDLLREGVAVADLTVILASFRAANQPASGLSEIVERVRADLRPALPGNQEGLRRIALPEEFESILALCVEEVDGKRFLSIPPEVAQNLLGILRAGLDGVERGDAAIVVRQPGLRPFVRRLAEIEFPSLPVLAEQELAPGNPPPIEWGSRVDHAAQMAMRHG